MDDEIPFYDLPQTAYPFTIIGVNADTEEELWRQEVTGAGLVAVPPKPAGVREVNIRIIWGDGTITNSSPADFKD